MGSEDYEVLQTRLSQQHSEGELGVCKVQWGSSPVKETGWRHPWEPSDHNTNGHSASPAAAPEPRLLVEEAGMHRPWLSISCSCPGSGSQSHLTGWTALKSLTVGGCQQHLTRGQQVLPCVSAVGEG